MKNNESLPAGWQLLQDYIVSMLVCDLMLGTNLANEFLTRWEEDTKKSEGRIKIKIEEENKIGKEMKIYYCESCDKFSIEEKSVCSYCGSECNTVR